MNKKIEYGFVAFTGVKWTNDMVDSYNALAEKIETHKQAGFDVEHLLNGRFNLFTAFSM